MMIKQLLSYFNHTIIGVINNFLQSVNVMIRKAMLNSTFYYNLLIDSRWSSIFFQWLNQLKTTTYVSFSFSGFNFNGNWSIYTGMNAFLSGRDFFLISTCHLCQQILSTKSTTKGCYGSSSAGDYDSLVSCPLHYL